MGIFLGLSLFVGIMTGTLVSAALVIVAIILTKKASRQRIYVWRVFAWVAIISLLALVLAVYLFPYDTGTPGSNYDILFGYYFLAGLAYSATPGAAALMAFLATRFCPMNLRAKEQTRLIKDAGL